MQPYLQDEERVVRESCVVALDTMDYWVQRDKAFSGDDGEGVES